MPSSLKSRSIRWAAPVIVAAVIGLVAVIPTLSAGATPSLAPLTPQQLLVKVQQAKVKTLSGTIRLTANLGIPNLSSLTGASGRDGAFNPADLVSGSHDARIWLDGPDRQRIALSTSLAETDFVHNGTSLYLWQSTGSKVTHQVLKAHAPDPAKPEASSKAAPMRTPDQAAKLLLDQITPSTTVVVTTPAYVAGRPAYELVLRPNAADSTVDHVGIAVDSATGLPLQVSLFAKGQATPALQLGFTAISFSRPAASTFNFTPPPNATVTNGNISSGQMAEVKGSGRRLTRGAKDIPAIAQQPATSGAAKIKIVGHDWTTTLLGSSIGQVPAQAGLLLQAATPVSGAWGSGRLVHTALINVLVMNDGRVAVGAVTPAALEAAVASAH